MYASKSGSWTVTTVESSGNSGRYCSLALTTGNDPRITYYKTDTSSGGDLKLATYSGSWSTEVVDGAGDDFGKYTSLRVDGTAPNDQYYVSSYMASYGDLITSTRTGFTGGWVSSSRDELGDVGKYSAVWRPQSQVAYYDATNGDLKWLDGDTETVFSSGDIGRFPAVGDSAGSPRIAYYDVTNGDLRYAWQTPEWTSVAVDWSGDVGQSISLAMSSSGQPRITYYDVTNGNLKLAERNGSTWSYTVVAQTGDVGGFSSLQLRAGEPHIVYYDATNGDLKSAWRINGNWGYGTIDATGDVGKYCVQVLDSLGNGSRVAYYDATNGDLKYAKGLQSSWAKMVVESSGDVGQYCSMVLGFLSSPRISYYDATNGDLRFAWQDSIPDEYNGSGCPDPPCEIDPAPATRLGSEWFQLARNPLMGNEPIRLKFALSRPTSVRLELIDVQGRLVAVRTDLAGDGVGRDEIDWNITSLRPGAYLVRARLASGVEKQLKVIKVR